MHWTKGEPPHIDGAEVLGWWDKSKVYAVILWSDRSNEWLSDEDGAVMNSPTHYCVLQPPAE